jgi:hypothetical protein
MLLTIQKIENTDKAILVTGETPCGTLKGIWKDDGSKPLQGKSYNVELTLGLYKQTIERKDVIIEKKQTEPLIAIQYDSVRFTGLCEEIEDIYFIRFFPDALVMLDIINDDHTITVGDYLTFSLPFDEIGIYPY